MCYFASDTNTVLTKRSQKDAEAPEVGEREELLEAWELHLSREAGTLTLRYLPPEGSKVSELRLLLRGSDGSWQERAFTADGSYLVFTAEEGENTFALIHVSPNYELLVLGAIAAGAVCVILIIIKIIRKVRRKNKK